MSRFSILFFQIEILNFPAETHAVETKPSEKVNNSRKEVLLMN